MGLFLDVLVRIVEKQKLITVIEIESMCLAMEVTKRSIC